MLPYHALLVSMLTVLACLICAEERTILESFIDPFRAFKAGFFDTLRSTHILNSKKMQVRSRSADVFPCETNGFRSLSEPTNVNKLMPGDIDVIGALGDSLTAGNGILASNGLQVLLEYRSVSFSIGGRGTWREFKTLPNFLKEFNPALIGYSLADVMSIDRRSQFNVAEFGAVSKNMPYMAKVLVQRIRSDPRVNMTKHWKMISLCVGANDFCSEVCYLRNLKDALQPHRRDIIRTLRILKDYLPRTIVNLVAAPNVNFLANVEGKPIICNTTHLISCPCIFGHLKRSDIPKHYQLVREWQNIDREISLMPEFNTDDFAVVHQPFPSDVYVPNAADNKSDFSLFSEDCFHLSQRGNAIAAQSFWNNLFEKVGEKHTNGIFAITNEFKCPTRNNPFIYTNKNSGIF